MRLFRTAPLLQPTAAARPQERIMLEATGVGVKYSLGAKGEDLQSLTYQVVLRKEKKETFWALRDVSLVGYAGDMVGIIGGNGAGKTTLCRVLAGLLRPDTGTLRVAGKVSALLSLGTGFKGELSGRDNILLNGMMLGLSRKQLEELLPEVVAFSGLARSLDQPLKHYSSGMRARLGFSIAALIEPEILLIDEALSTGDLEFSEKAGRKMQELVSKAKMVIVVTHQMAFIEKYCTRALWLEQGTVRAEGLPHDVVGAYGQSLPESSRTKRTVTITTVENKMDLPHRGAPVVEVHSLGVRFSLPGRRLGNHGKLHFFSPFLGRQHARFWALRDVNFTVYGGDIVGIIGPNGAGKTTLCRALAGILRADRGDVMIKGSVTAFLAFGTGFHGQLTGRDNVYLNGMMLGFPRKSLQALYPDIVEFSGLGRFMDELVKNYSSGMRARLGFSIAAMVSPDVLIIDEALSVGDLAFSQKASTKMRDLIAQAKAVIVVTHNLSFVEQVCTRALWLNDGTVQFDGDPKEAVARYRQSLRR